MYCTFLTTHDTEKFKINPFTEPKKKYFIHDLKQEHTEVDKETGEMIIVPGREDSYERLSEVEKQFAEKIIVNYRPFIYWLSTWRGDNQLYNKSVDSGR